MQQMHSAAAIAAVAVAAVTAVTLWRSNSAFFLFRRHDARPAQAESPNPGLCQVMMALDGTGQVGKQRKTVKAVEEF